MAIVGGRASDVSWSFSRFRTTGCSAVMTVATSTSQGTTTSNESSGVLSSRTHPIPEPARVAPSSHGSWCLRVWISARKAPTPPR